MPCFRGCCATPQDHYRSVGVNFNVQAERDKDKKLALYRQARKEGSQPFGTSKEDSETAMRESDALGRPFRADDMVGTYHPEAKEHMREWTPEEKKAFREELAGAGS